MSAVRNWIAGIVPRARLLGAAAVALGTLGLAGCAPRHANIVPAEGRLTRVGADPSLLAGHIIETLPDDSTRPRASGLVGPDGTFTLETLTGGEIVAGASRGRHRARIMLSDDDPAVRKRAATAIPTRYLDFESSGWTFDLPGPGPVDLSVAAK